MVRETLKKNRIGLNPHFNYRGEEQTRIEAFTDAVFAFAVTLLVLSNSIPETFEDLKASFSDIIPFGLAISILVSIWFDHYIFSIRYGFRDGYITMLNTLLLFLVLIYVYPLKFLMSLLTKMFYALIAQDFDIYRTLFTEVIRPADTWLLMIFYGLGVVAIFGTLAFMYLYALKRRGELELSDLEIFETKTSMYVNLCLMVPPLLSSLVAISGIGSMTLNFILAGNIYMLYPILIPLYSRYRNKRRKLLFPDIA